MIRRAAACAIVWCATANANPDAAPPAHTGAFGEPSCHACHFDGPAREPGGPTRLLGLPAQLVAGAVYELVIEVEADSPSAGFQLTVRDTCGRQAGTLARTDGTTRLEAHDGIQYLGHADPSRHRWRFTWRAPEKLDAVVFAGAVNVANDDQSEFGDEIYLITEWIEMERKRCD